jgi:septal ring factor EnvC (AmiA/AmiB activator)
MNSLKSIALVAGISLLTLVGCTSTKEAAVQTPPNGSPAQSVSTTSTTGNNNLLTAVSKTKTAVTAGDFVQAKKEFDEFEDVWEEVEDGIEAKSRPQYEAIEKSMDEVERELKASQPQKDKLLASLQSLEKDIIAVSKG